MAQLESTEAVFIIGSPRSGTSVLAWALAQHPDFWTSAESDFIKLLFGGGHCVNAYRQAHQRPGVGWLEKNSVDFEEFARYLGYGIDRLFLSRSGGKRWVDSTPGYTLIGPLLASLFPRARFLHIMRDGRAVVSSLIHSGFDVKAARDFKTACRVWSHYIRLGRKQEREYPDRTLEVRHEDLVADPPAFFARVLDFLGAERDPRPAEYASKKRINSSYGNRSPEDVRKAKDPFTTSPRPWLSWNRRMNRTFDRIAGETMAEFGFGDLAKVGAAPDRGGI